MSQALVVYFGFYISGVKRKEFVVIGGSPHGRFRPCDERAPISDCDRLVLYDAETNSLQIRTAEGVNRDEPLGHAVVVSEVAL